MAALSSTLALIANMDRQSAHRHGSKKKGARMQNLINNNPEDQSSLVISEKNIPFSAYQAIYHKITKRVEKLRKSYKEAYTISISDIQNLDQRLNQLISQYTIAGKRCEITHSTKDGDASIYSSVQKFTLANHSARECTSTLSYEFDFLITLPSTVSEARDIAQRYKLQLIFDQTFLDKDDARIPFFMRGFTSKSDLTLTLEYTDYAVAQAVEAVVTGWVGTLPKRQESSAMRLINSSEAMVRQFLDTIAQFTAMCSGAAYILNKNPVMNISIFVSLISIALGYLSYNFVSYAVDQFYNTSRKLNPCACVLITMGDKDRVSNNEKIVSKTRATLGFIASSIILALMINISSAWIYDRAFQFHLGR